MLPVFCLRLACGLIAVLPVLPLAQVHPRFFRVQYLTALGLLAAAVFFLHDLVGVYFWAAWAFGVLACFAGSISWHVEGHPLRHLILALAVCALTAILLLGGLAVRADTERPARPFDPRSHWGVGFADDLTSAALLGSATAAMLMGHSYLIAPAMSLTPLFRLLLLLGAALFLRLALAGMAFFWWTETTYTGSLETETMLWLGVRWIIGLVLPIVLCWMAWETARIRSTQSATGILYVVVILGFLGELTSQLLLAKTGALL
ncbi:MAG: hypothetical protein L0Y72_18745 [Gemmataceae bacterium]|nr:hypothetical protein [Gemmataceae bacterium]MCI0741087.1 hypothetical protein [Gemmataceae bacterium]